jgi:Caspase domain/TIR domain
MVEPQSGFEDPVGAPSASPGSLEFQAFISYNSKDRQRIELLFQELDRRGVRVWYDQREKVAGTISADLMAGGIARSERCAVFLGEHGEGPWQSEEQQLALAEAVQNNRPVFAVLLPGWGSNILPPNLSIRTYVDLQDAFADTGITSEGGDKLEAAMRGCSVGKLHEWRARQSEPPSAPEVTIRRGRWRAVVAAVSTYKQQGWNALHGPLSDADVLAQALGELTLPSGGGWEVTKILDPTREKLIDALQELFAAEEAEDDTVLFYYSGHGVMSDQVPYLCAVDTRLEALSWTGIMAQTVVEFLKGSRAAKKIVILDCCHGKPVRMDGNPYKDLGPGAAVIGASEGLAEDAERATEASPFTSELVRIMRSPDAHGQAGLTVGILLDELARSEQKPWTNTQPDRDILIASRGGPSPPEQRDAVPAVRVTLKSGCVPRDYLPLLSQVVRMLDDIMALSDDEDTFPSNAVRSAMRLLGEEFARLLFSPGDHDSLAEALRLAGDNQPPRLELQFEDETIRDAIGDLPWEYLALHCPSGVPELRDSADVLRNPRLPVERLVETPPTKHAVLPTPQQVVLFSSLESTAAPAANPQRDMPHVLTVNAIDKLRHLSVPTDVVTPASWQEFLGHSAPASLVILQAPLRWADHELTIGFFKQASQVPRFVDFESVLGVLKDRRAMIWLVIETVADHPEWQSPSAARKLAERFAQRLKIATVAVCHPRAFSGCLRDNPHANSFVARLVDELIDGTPLDRAAHVARSEVLNTLAPKEAAVVGIPRVLQPYQREAQSATRVPKRALGSRDPKP